MTVTRSSDARTVTFRAARVFWADSSLVYDDLAGISPHVPPTGYPPTSEAIPLAEVRTTRTS